MADQEEYQNQKLSDYKKGNNMKQRKELIFIINPEEEEELNEMYYMKFVLLSKMVDFDGEIITDSNGDEITITNVFSHLNKNLLFDKIIELNKEKAFNYIHEISYEAY